MTHRPHHPRPQHRTSDRVQPPDDVTDRLLWALAVDVAAAHRPGPDGNCANLQCRGQQGACWALRAALHAEQCARRAATDARPVAAPRQMPAPRPRGRAGTAQGLATVPTARGHFAGWFTSTATPAAPMAAEPRRYATPAAAPSRRPLGATLAA
ncbi:hypothetical protein GCM10023322_79070 [Rugosimonospora acidiphila]|uniref:Uncharacterized protein n=1 Tax=Rugosimonospora acidiphila TaxID=556531 RepID=A0ABP9SSW8_9ACTN